MMGARMVYLLIGIAVALAGLMLWVRLAPSDIARWHQAPEILVPGVQDHPGGVRLITDVYDLPPSELLAKFDRIARATPRTQVLAGDVGQGMITYVTRSAFWGFPDYTTVKAIKDTDGSRLAINARLRFGKSDFGVNKARVTRWLQSLDQG